MRTVAFVLIVAASLTAAGAVAQEKRPTAAKMPADSLTARQDAPAPAQPASDELILGEINIEAIVEKPNVEIIPRRREPDLNEIAFIDRSFDREIKAIPKELRLYDPELDTPKKLGSIEKVIRERKKSKSNTEK